MVRVKDSKKESSQKAQKEFKTMVANLKKHNIQVSVYKQKSDDLPDSVFPNNWFSTHKDENIPKGVFFTYPMKVPSRQREINPDIITEIGQNYKQQLTLKAARKGEALEGTGSLVIDSRLKKIYCCLSERADFNTLIKFNMKLSKLAKQDYKLVSFVAKDAGGSTIYHTNVMLAILDKHAICCLDSVADAHDREALKKELTDGGREIVDISFKEMGEMCGNMI